MEEERNYIDTFVNYFILGLDYNVNIKRNLEAIAIGNCIDKGLFIIKKYL